MNKSNSLAWMVGAAVLGTLLLAGAAPLKAQDAAAQDAAAQDAALSLSVDVAQPGATVSPTLYGIFFEDINRAGDGGLYAEMVQNRSFEDHSTPLSWTALPGANAQVEIVLDRQSPLNALNPTSLRMRIIKADGRIGIYNQGFKGVPQVPRENTENWLPRFEAAQRGDKNGLAVQAGKNYDLSLYARAVGFAGPLTLSLETQAGALLASQRIEKLPIGWAKFEATLVPNASDANARLVIAADKPGTIWLDMVSLFPRDTYKNRKNGWRPDMMAMMAAMQPRLLRFPGGSFSEGRILADAWRWKETLGDIAQRPGSWNIWGYRSTNGLGFHEYLQLAEDLGAEPLFVAHVGMAEQGFVPLDELEPWIQDALDAIEYANGPATSQWGALRAQNGHPAPFNLKYVEIGNENGMGYSWGGGNRRDYLPRYQAFFERIKAQHPEITTIANIHTEPDVPAEVVDEHYYPAPEWFLANTRLYDSYDRKKPKIYVGEYATKAGAGSGNLSAALAEAAFLTGVERNADVVAMTSYAPLFTNPQWERWKPDAIVFDNTRLYGTPSYHVQALFAANRPDVVLPLQLDGVTETKPTLFGVAGLRRSTREIILKVVNVAETPRAATINLRGASLAAQGSATLLTSDNLKDENSFEAPAKIAPRELPLTGVAPSFRYTFAARSLTILRLPQSPAAP